MKLNNELQTLIEATLFGSGKSMSVDQLSHGLKEDTKLVSEALHGLRASLKRRKGGALQIVEISGKWALEVKPAIADKLPKDAKTDISPRLLKAAALIAYHQPMEQSSLVKLLGVKAYNYVKELSDSGLIDRRRSGNTRKLTTTRRFSEVFGCPHTSHKKVRMWFRERSEQLGMTEGELIPISIEDDVDLEQNLENIIEE